MLGIRCGGYSAAPSTRLLDQDIFSSWVAVGVQPRPGPVYDSGRERWPAESAGNEDGPEDGPEGYGSGSPGPPSGPPGSFPPAGPVGVHPFSSRLHDGSTVRRKRPRKKLGRDSATRHDLRLERTEARGPREAVSSYKGVVSQVDGNAGCVLFAGADHRFPLGCGLDVARGEIVTARQEPVDKRAIGPPEPS